MTEVVTHAKCYIKGKEIKVQKKATNYKKWAFSNPNLLHQQHSSYYTLSIKDGAIVKHDRSLRRTLHH